MLTSLVTGGAGFIGSHLSDLLRKNGHRVIIIDDLSTGKKSNIHPMTVFYKLDVQSNSIQDVFQKERPDFIFHLAAKIDVQKSIEDPIQDSKVNILGSLNVLENSIKTGVKKVIFSSSCAIYGEQNLLPTKETCAPKYLSPYGINKLFVEKYLAYYKLTHGLNYIALRLSNVYGPRQNIKGEGGVVSIFSHRIANIKPLIINGNGKQTRDFVFVKDVAAAFYLASKSDFCGELNVGTGKETSVNELYAKLTKIYGKTANAIHGPSKISDQKRSSLSINKIKKYLKWKPEYSIEKGLEETASWFQKEGKI